MPDTGANEILKSATETVRDVLTESRVSEKASAEIIDALTSVQILFYARVAQIIRHPKEELDEVVVHELEGEDGILKMTHYFLFPPNDPKTLAEFKRAQDGDRSILVDFRSIGDGPNKIVRLLLRSTPTKTKYT